MDVNVLHSLVFQNNDALHFVGATSMAEKRDIRGQHVEKCTKETKKDVQAKSDRSRPRAVLRQNRKKSSSRNIRSKTTKLNPTTVQMITIMTKSITPCY